MNGLSPPKMMPSEAYCRDLVSSGNSLKVMVFSETAAAPCDKADAPAP